MNKKRIQNPQKRTHQNPGIRILSLVLSLALGLGLGQLG